MTIQRRLTQFRLRLVGRSPSDYAQELQDFLKDLFEQNLGIPGGFFDVLPVPPGDEASAGDPADGWAAARHGHETSVQVQSDGAVVGTRKAINFTDVGDDGYSEVSDNPGDNRVDVTLNLGALNDDLTLLQYFLSRASS